MTAAAELPYELGDGEARLRVRVTPGAAHNHAGGLYRSPEGRVSLLVRVTTPPEMGKANKAVIDILASVLGLAKSRLTVKTGSADRNKLIAIAGDPADFQSALHGLAKGQEHQEY